MLVETLQFTLSTKFSTPASGLRNGHSAPKYTAEFMCLMLRFEEKPHPGAVVSPVGHHSHPAEPMNNNQSRASKEGHPAAIQRTTPYSGSTFVLESKIRKF